MGPSSTIFVWSVCHCAIALTSRAGNGSSISTPAYPYSHRGALTDVVSGSNGSCGGSYLCTGTVGYDGLIYARGGRIVGHVFWQRHGAALHGFSTAVPEGLEGGGYAAVMLLDFVAHAAHLPGITRARVGRGRNNITRRLLARLKRHADALGWQIGDDGWVTFRPPSDSARPVAAHDQISSAASSNDASV